MRNQLELAGLITLILSCANAQLAGQFFSCYLSGDTTGHSSWCGDNQAGDLYLLQNPNAAQAGIQNAVEYHNRMVWTPTTYIGNPPPLPSGPGPSIVPHTPEGLPQVPPVPGPLIPPPGIIPSNTLQPVQAQLPTATDEVNPLPLPPPPFSTVSENSTFLIDSKASTEKINVGIKAKKGEPLEPESIIPGVSPEAINGEAQTLIVNAAPIKNGAISMKKATRDGIINIIRQKETEPSVLPIYTSAYSQPEPSADNAVRQAPSRQRPIESVPPNLEIDELRNAEAILALSPDVPSPKHRIVINSQSPPASREELMPTNPQDNVGILRTDSISKTYDELTGRTKIPMIIKKVITPNSDIRS